VQAKADKKGEKEEEDEAGSVTSEEFNTFLDAMGGRAKERTSASTIIGSYLHCRIVFYEIFSPSHFFAMVE
jgi:hypothetical protein